MSVLKYDKESKQLTTLASGQRCWIGTKAQHDAAIQQGTMPNNMLVYITDDYEEGIADDPAEGDERPVSSGGVWTALQGKQDAPTILSRTLAAGSTTVTFTGLPTEGDYFVDFFTSNGIGYEEINTTTAGTVTLTYEAQSSAVTVYCKIEEVVI